MKLEIFVNKKPSFETSKGTPRIIKKPIAQVLSLRLATFITLITIIVGVVSYFYSMASTEELVREQLMKYIGERGMRESALFLESDEYQARFQKEYIERYKRMGDKDPIEWFEEHMEKRPEDGTYRSKSELYYGKDRELGRLDVSASMMIGAKTEITPEVRRALAIGYEMINQYGPAWRKPFVDLYFSSPEKTSVSRWPGTPWGLMMDDKVEWRDEEWMAITMKEKNPQREQRWSGVLYDERNGNWMVSGVTPLDIDGKQVGMVGTDLLLDDLVERTINETLSGTYNILLQGDGRVIVHPQKVEEIIANKGMLLAKTSDDAHLIRIYELAQTVTTFPSVINNSRDNEILAFTRIKGPDWYFITVYPKLLLADRVLRNVGFVFLSGMASLTAMFLVIWLVLKRNLVYPLGRLTQAVRNFKIPMSQLSESADEFIEKTSELSTHPDEIGLLANSFLDMGSQLRTTYNKLEANEEKYRTLFERETDAIFIYDPETTNILDANKATSKIYGYDKDELVGMSCLNFNAEVDKSASTINRLRKEDEANVSYRLHRKKDGTVFPVDISDYAITLGGKNVMYAVSKDISERMQLEKEKQKIHKIESIGILAGGIAHDFNNLLTGILNNVYLSKMHLDLKSKEYKYLESAEKAISRATNLTQQLLTFAKGGNPIKKTASIVEIIKESAEFVLKGSNVKCDYFIADDLWPVEVDEGQMTQVIHNLILNANQSMPEGGTIRIRTENSIPGSDTGLPLKEGRYVKVTIQDQGTGISEKHLKNIFNPYFTTKEAGHGLGLSITYSIIKQHDGFLTAESKLELGTIFTIYLPASEKQIEEKERVECTAVAGDGKILIMDDEEIIRESVVEFLGIRGYEVEYAEDGEEAIELYKKAHESSQPFNAVVLDLTIRGGMGGKTAIKKLLEINSYVKAIVSSGYSNDPVMANFREYGFSGVFNKASNSPDDLCKILNEVIEE